jgi:multiple sugar transport system permease protein
MKPRAIAARICLYLLLSGLAVLFLIPLMWMIFTAFKTPLQTVRRPMDWFPDPATIDNMVKIFVVAPMLVYIRNSVFVTLMSVIGCLASATLVAFSFARLRWFGRDVLFIVLLSAMMVPQQSTMIPVFLIMNQLGWINTLNPLIVPSFFAASAQGAFYVFLLRQFIMTIPRELDESARIDGCSLFQIYLFMILPLLRPAIGTVAIFSFMEHWNEFMLPLIYLKDQMQYTLPVGIQLFRNEAQIDWNKLMSASLVSVIPAVIIFFLGQKYFLRGIVVSGNKE